MDKSLEEYTQAELKAMYKDYHWLQDLYLEQKSTTKEIIRSIKELTKEINFLMKENKALKATIKSRDILTETLRIKEEYQHKRWSAKHVIETQDF